MKPTSSKGIMVQIIHVIKKPSELSQVLNLNSNRPVKCRTERCGLHHVHGVLEKMTLPLFKDDPFSMKRAWMNLRQRTV